MLILDEASSNLDSEKEGILLGKIQEYFKGTIIFVSHRASIIEKASDIIMLDHGEIVEQGSPQEMMANNTYCYRQFLGFQNPSMCILQG